jgi:uncharacterized SAM-binding protein YcdF (DUF218 family)
VKLIGRKTLLGVAAVSVACIVFHNQILWQMGAVMVNSGPPEPADIVVILAGDASGHRIMKAAELVREGYAPRVVVSGAGRFYGIPESTLEVDFAVERGYPREYFIPLQHPALSTREEARFIVDKLKELHVHKYLMVTSYYHTARAGRIFRRTAPELQMRIVGATAPHWNDGYWWKERQGQKIWLEEDEKTFADFFRI